MAIPIQAKTDVKVAVTWVAVLGVIIYAFVVNRITWEVMVGYFACLGIPSIFMQKRSVAMRERRGEKLLPSLNTPVTYSPTEITKVDIPKDPRESGER